jgi:2-polyprenyl-6-methoxyphenol hydroxylase-like FAD-dependent oxidoreductase
MSSSERSVLISGAGIAGLAAAFWMQRLGFAVTIVERAHELRRGGAAVNIQDGCVDVVRDMGLLDAILANRLSVRRFEFKDVHDVSQRVMTLREEDAPPSETDIEVERSVLLDLLHVALGNDAETIFGDTVTALHDGDGGVRVTFAHNEARTFDLVLGCDGFNSTVRRIGFGPPERYAHYLGPYFSLSIVNKLLIEPDTAQLFNVPGKAIMLNAYKNKTDVIFAFTADDTTYDRARQREWVADEFAGVGWRTAELLAEVADCTDFYFDRLGQIRMPKWSCGRVALVGDAAYCASPAAGRGGSLALEGAAALAAAMRAHDGDHALAFDRYEADLRAYVEDVQQQAVTFGLESLVPSTQDAIDARNAGTGSSF